MQEAISNFLDMLYEEFIYPFSQSIIDFINNSGQLVQDFFKIFFNWLLNIGRETPYDFFKEIDVLYFLQDLIDYILIIISIILLIKLIKSIFKPIFKLLNIGGDIKWRR